MQLVLKKILQDRASLFLQGRHEDLLVSCGKEDRMCDTQTSIMVPLDKR